MSRPRARTREPTANVTVSSPGEASRTGSASPCRSRAGGRGRASSRRREAGARGRAHSRDPADRWPRTEETGTRQDASLEASITRTHLENSRPLARCMVPTWTAPGVGLSSSSGAAGVDSSLQRRDHPPAHASSKCARRPRCRREPVPFLMASLIQRTASATSAARVGKAGDRGLGAAQKATGGGTALGATVEIVGRVGQDTIGGAPDLLGGAVIDLADVRTSPHVDAEGRRARTPCPGRCVGPRRRRRGGLCRLAAARARRKRSCAGRRS